MSPLTLAPLFFGLLVGIGFLLGLSHLVFRKPDINSGGYISEYERLRRKYSR